MATKKAGTEVLCCVSLSRRFKKSWWPGVLSLLRQSTMHSSSDQRYQQVLCWTSTITTPINVYRGDTDTEYTPVDRENLVTRFNRTYKRGCPIFTKCRLLYRSFSTPACFYSTSFMPNALRLAYRELTNSNFSSHEPLLT